MTEIPTPDMSVADGVAPGTPAISPDAAGPAPALRRGRRFGRAPDRASGRPPEPGVLRGQIERCLVSDSGAILVIGWLADEGCGPLDIIVEAADLAIPVPADAVLRHARPDVQAEVRDGPYDYGFLLLGAAPAGASLATPLRIGIASSGGVLRTQLSPDFVSDKRLMDTVLIVAAHAASHVGSEVARDALLRGSAGRSLASLFEQHVAYNTAGVYVERFNAKPVARSFITVLFGTTEPLRLQPVLFATQGIDFGEWIYVCNSPEDATAALRLARLVSGLYAVMITVIVMGDNVGFGAANNVAIAHAAGRDIYIVNPDVYPVGGHVGTLRRSLGARDLGSHLWGGLLFYDDHTLMHSGMFIEADRFFPCRTFHKNRFGLQPNDESHAVTLLRVEHFDKGTPFRGERWPSSLSASAVTGALMAFRRAVFERLGGFSTRYIYGHYEDADLSIRWADEAGSVLIDTDLRLVHLEGQGSRPRGEQYGAAATVNRHLFSALHAQRVLDEPERFARARIRD